MKSDATFILLFCLATAVALASRRLRLPYTVALVLAGLGLGSLHVFEGPELTKELLFAVFLPGLLFEAAFHLDIARVRENVRMVLALAVPGVVATIAVTGLMTAWMLRGLQVDATFTLTHGLVFGALIAATDPIAVVALFRVLRVPSRLSLLVEGESLLNDGTAIVFFSLVVAVAGGATPGVGSLVTQFVGIAAGGALIGVLVGLASSYITRAVDEAAIEITLTVIAAYGAFVAAEAVHASGVIATVAAGLMCGNVGRVRGMTPTTRIAVVAFWEYIAFALNSVVFLLIGFAVSIGDLVVSWREIAVATLAMLVARCVVVAAVAFLFRRTSEALPRAWTTVLAWGGIRGGLSIVLALGLPVDMPHRAQLVAMTLGVVLSSILVQGLTMAPLLRWLGLTVAKSLDPGIERARVEQRIAAEVLEEITKLRDRYLITAGDAERLAVPYRARLTDAQRSLAVLAPGDVGLATERERAVRHLLALEATLAAESYRADLISPGVHEELSRTLAERRLRLSHLDFARVDDVLGRGPAGSASPGTPPSDAESRGD